MSQRNKALTRRFSDETLDNKNLADVDELRAAGCVNHSAPPGCPAARRA